MTFLLVSPRSGAEILAAEYRDFLVATGLDRTELDHTVLDSLDSTLPDYQHYDGIFIGGSPFNITDTPYSELQKYVHSLLEELMYSTKKTMFVCFGAGFCTHIMGGIIGRTHPESSGPSIVHLTEEGSKDPLTSNLPQEFSVLTGHTENIVQLGQGARLLATGPSCPVQIIRVNETSWACQFHAEMDAIGMKNRMDFYFDYGYFSPEDYEAITALLPSVDTTYSHQVLRNFISLCLENT